MSRAARLGAFIFATLAILAAGVFIIGSKQYIFSSTYQLKAQFADVVGLDAGADVRVGGVHSGTVRSIVLPHQPGEKVTVVMDLRKSTHEIIKQDSVASIETEGLLGNQYLAISFGSTRTAQRPGRRHHCQPAATRNVSPAQKMSGILDSSQQAIQNATGATGHLEAISAKIDGGQGTVGALVNDKQLYNNLALTTGALQDTIVHAPPGVTDFQEDMEALKHNFFLRGYFKNRGYEDSAALAKNEVERLPQGTAMKEFTFPTRQFFDKQDSARLKNQKGLKAVGEFLADNQFGFAVIVASAGMEGDTAKDLLLTEARAMVVREYLIENFEFDDIQLGTLGMGKQTDTASDAGWGTVRIVIYPVGSEIPPNKQPQAGT